MIGPADVISCWANLDGFISSLELKKTSVIEWYRFFVAETIPKHKK
jgi:hypothetical protein